MRILPLALALVFAGSAAAQVTDLDTGTITVVGSASVTAPPDRAVVRLGVQTRAETAAEALRQHETDVARVLTQIRTFGIPDRHIVIESLNLGENYGRDGVDGYQAFRVVSVATDSLRIVPELIASVVEVGANRLDGLYYTVRESEPYQNQALDEAMARARAKAERLAAASGRTLGRVVAVLEQGSGVVESFRRMPYNTDAVAVEAEARPGAYSTGASQVQASVLVQFALTDG